MSRTILASVWPPTATIAASAGHARISPIQAIRRKCLDCCGNQPNEVKLCETVTCALWPFRAGRHPYTKRGLQEADPGQGATGGSPVPARDASSRTALQGADLGQGVHDAVDPSPSLVPDRRLEAMIAVLIGNPERAPALPTGTDP